MDDAPGLLLIYAPIVKASCISFEYVPPALKEMRDRIKTGSQNYPWLAAADDNGNILGYAYACSWRVRRAYQWSTEVSVYIHPDHQRKGIATALYAALLKQLKAQGYVVAYAAITLPNPESTRFHHALGFRPSGRFEACGYKLGSWHDVEFWGLDLAPRESNPENPMPPSIKNTS